MPTIRISDVVHAGLGRLVKTKGHAKTLNGVIQNLLLEKNVITDEEIRNQVVATEFSRRTAVAGRMIEFSEAETKAFIEKLGTAPRKFRYQRDAMRELYHHFGDDKAKLVRGYAWLETQNRVERRSNAHSLDADYYAEALYADGKKKGWLKE